MHVWLMRHGEPVSEAVDPARPLSRRGREEVERVAAALRRAEVAPLEIRHSLKRRAEETARIVGRALAGSPRLVERAGMAPGDDVEPMRGEIEVAGEPLMLVGHLPYLGRLASALLVGDTGKLPFQLATAGVICLLREGRGVWKLAWMTDPALLPPHFSGSAGGSTGGT